MEVPAGTLLAAVGTTWAAFSELSGETHLLNDEAAAFLEVLLERPRTLNEAAEVMAADSGLTLREMLPLLADAEVDLEAAGLIRPVSRH